MQTSGLLIRLTPKCETDAVAMSLGARRDLELGDLVPGDAAVTGLCGGAWPAVLEASSGRGSAAAVREIEGLPGIERVDVVFVGLDETDGEVS